MGAVHRAPSDYPSGKKGDVLTVEFTVAGVPCLGLNGGPAFKHNEAFSFQIATDDQQETDRYWNAIVGNGGQESACGWCKDKWGISWQITPRVLTEAMAAGGEEAKRAFDAMMDMKKIDVAAIKAARRGRHGWGASSWRLSPQRLLLAGISSEPIPSDPSGEAAGGSLLTAAGVAPRPLPAPPPSAPISSRNVADGHEEQRAGHGAG